MTKKAAKNWALGLLFALAVVVVLQNTETVETRILFATVAMPRALLLFVTLVAGGGVGYVLGARRRGAKPD